jgi:hypothetical protein
MAYGVPTGNQAVSTNDPNGLGYQTGFFSAPPGNPIDQTFFNQAFAGHINTNKIYKEAYGCSIVGMCNSSMWMEQFMGVETDCYPEYTLLEYNGRRMQIKAAAGVTIPAYPATGNITLSAKDHFVNGAYVLPIVGNLIVLPPSGNLAVVTVVTHATANDTIITVQQVSHTAGSQVIPNGAEMLVVPGAEIADCACPTGSPRFDDMPIEHDLKMATWGDRIELCGDALNKCQFLKIPFYDADGKVVDERWYTEAQQEMYRGLERYKHWRTYLDPNFGIIPTIKARGINFTPASNDEITTDDIRYYKSQLDLAGVMGREYAIFAGGNKFSQYQRMLQAAGVTQLDHSEQPLNDCKWLNLEWCGIRVEGLTLHIYDECSFSNGKELGSTGMVFPNSAIWVPMFNRPQQVKRSIDMPTRNGYTEKMFTRVYFKDISKGRVWDVLSDSNGILGPRNTFGAGCETHEWTVKTRFLNEIHCSSHWGFEGL